MANNTAGTQDELPSVSWFLGLSKPNLLGAEFLLPNEVQSMCRKRRPTSSPAAGGSMAANKKLKTKRCNSAKASSPDRMTEPDFGSLENKCWPKKAAIAYEDHNYAAMPATNAVNGEQILEQQQQPILSINQQQQQQQQQHLQCNATDPIGRTYCSAGMPFAGSQISQHQMPQQQQQLLQPQPSQFQPNSSQSISSELFAWPDYFDEQSRPPMLACNGLGPTADLDMFFSSNNTFFSGPTGGKEWADDDFLFFNSATENFL